MVSEYVSAALHPARYEILAEENSYYGEIPGRGWASEPAHSTPECPYCRKMTERI